MSQDEREETVARAAGVSARLADELGRGDVDAAVQAAERTAPLSSTFRRVEALSVERRASTRRRSQRKRMDAHELGALLRWPVPPDQLPRSRSNLLEGEIIQMLSPTPHDLDPADTHAPSAYTIDSEGVSTTRAMATTSNGSSSLGVGNNEEMLSSSSKDVLDSVNEVLHALAERAPTSPHPPLDVWDAERRIKRGFPVPFGLAQAPITWRDVLEACETTEALPSSAMSQLRQKLEARYTAVSVPRSLSRAPTRSGSEDVSMADGDATNS